MCNLIKIKGIKIHFKFHYVKCMYLFFHSKVKGSDNQEKLVYQIIEDAGNKGNLHFFIVCV